MLEGLKVGILASWKVKKVSRFECWQVVRLEGCKVGRIESWKV